MRRFCVSILMAFCSFACHGETIQVNDMEQIFEYFKDANAKTLAVFDVDMVLIQPSDPAFQIANMKRFSDTAKRIMKQVPAEKQMIFLSLMTISSDPMLVDLRILEFLQKLSQNGVMAMALTANLTGEFGNVKNMEQTRIDNLKKLGIDFSESIPYQVPFAFEDLPKYRGNYSTYRDGILFVNGTVTSKGDALLAFLKKSNLSLNKIIFIDDREDNLKSVESAIQKAELPIEYQGIHFTGANKYPSEEISEDVFESKWQKIASNVKELE